ncbi:MAG: N-acetyl-gamma-glutamyl-phosphate reductase [Clostridia bacterium]|nr:N-acetyl-gamma-glutamyl-phosphate reductase [Clostridia bacterium]
MINVGILGATGYAGIETVRLLATHPEVKITRLISHSFEGKKISEIYPSLEGVLDIECTSLDVDDISKNCDLVFTALPHGVSKDVIPGLYKKGLKIIDLSGDFRYNDVKVYEKWYGESHPSPELLEKSVYGLCELYRDKIKETSLVGNPGCYTTCSILALYPLLKAGIIETKNIIIDAKSGVTGAGRTTKLDYSFCECTENMLAYKVATHRHTSEIEQELSIAAGSEVMVSFTPHLVPLKRGIYATCYANLAKNVTGEEVEKIYKDFYKGEYFIRIMNSGKIPESNWVAGSNFANIGFQIDERLGRIVVCSTIDNLIKGAAGQAVQNMNIMMGFEENAGLDMPAMYL